jgi:ribosome-binding protein aMBF1 (putative translation factor)
LSVIIICDECGKKIKNFHIVAINKDICLDFCDDCIKNPDIEKAKANHDYFYGDKKIFFKGE